MSTKREKSQNIYGELPKIIKTDYKIAHFPTLWQAVIFRNYGKVETRRIAAVLQTNQAIVDFEAQRLGINLADKNSVWQDKGYLTIIRANWYLLSYDNLLLLLDITKEKLQEILRDEDFFITKLGGFKPLTQDVKYIALTEQQIERTYQIAQITTANCVERKSKYFDFFAGDDILENAQAQPTQKVNERIIYGYGASLINLLERGDFSELSPKYLKMLVKSGVNGLWIGATLSKLTLFPFLEEVSSGYSDRLKRLNELIEYLDGFGIKLYLYLNEPRSMPLEFFDAYPHLKGTVLGGDACLCTSQEPVKDYLYNSVKSLAQSAKKLGGIITITMSENLTNCNSPSIHAKQGKEFIPCKVCSKLEAYRPATDVNKIIAKALKDANSNTSLIVWNWGWSSFMGWTKQDELQAIKNLPEGCAYMCVSEEGLELDFDGVKSRIIDYSVANPGPSARTAELLALAKQAGHRVLAKTQINNSWEMAAVPFIPVFELIYKHMSALTQNGIDGIMLGWTLGGYPSPSLRLAHKFYDGKIPCLSSWYEQEFGDCAVDMQKASERFSSAFANFPFDLPFLYNGPQNFGCANLFFEDKPSLKSTIIGFPFEDVDGWRGVFTAKELSKQLEKLSNGWEEGLQILQQASGDNQNFTLSKMCAIAAGCHFKSSLLILQWAIEKQAQKPNKAMLLQIVEDEAQNTKRLIDASANFAEIGYEASNHYFYHDNLLLEKLVNLNYIKQTI